MAEKNSGMATAIVIVGVALCVTVVVCTALATNHPEIAVGIGWAIGGIVFLVAFLVCA